MSDTIEQQLAAVLAGTYKIEGELGRGAMALVYLATDFRHGRKVAVNVLPPEMATHPGERRRLGLEAVHVVIVPGRSGLLRQEAAHFDAVVNWDARWWRSMASPPGISTWR